MGLRYCWALAATLLPMLTPMPVLGQLVGEGASADLGRKPSSTTKRLELPAKKTPRRTRSRTAQFKTVASANDWNPSYFRGKEHFIEGRYDEALIELNQNVADCRDIDFDAKKRQNSYFAHVWTSTTQMGQSPHDFIRASNLQWVGAALAAQGRYDQAETRFAEMENYAAHCFPGRYNTFEGCSCQGLAFLLAARGHYDESVDRYRLALKHIEENQSQIGLPPPPCVAMILVGLADVELARGRAGSAERYLKRAQQIQEAQQLLSVGPAPLDKAALETIFAQLRTNQERYSEAVDLHVQALATIKEVREDHPLTAFCLDGLGEIDLGAAGLARAPTTFNNLSPFASRPWVKAIAISLTATTAWRASPSRRRKTRPPSGSSGTLRRSWCESWDQRIPTRSKLATTPGTTTTRRILPTARHVCGHGFWRCRPCSHSGGKFFISAKIGAGSKRRSDCATQKPTGRCIERQCRPAPPIWLTHLPNLRAKAPLYRIPQRDRSGPHLGDGL